MEQSHVVCGLWMTRLLLHFRQVRVYCCVGLLVIYRYKIPTVIGVGKEPVQGLWSVFSSFSCISRTCVYFRCMQYWGMFSNV